MAQISLSHGLFTTVDEADLDRLSAFKWKALINECNTYAYRNSKLPSGKKIVIFMHREINGTPIGMITDHINGNSLDNRKENLRSATHAQNMANRKKAKSNRSGFKGVYFDPSKNSFVAEINSGNKRTRLGKFSTAEEAYSAYVRASLEIHGKFSRELLIKEESQ